MHSHVEHGNEINITHCGPNTYPSHFLNIKHCFRKTKQDVWARFGRCRDAQSELVRLKTVFNFKIKNEWVGLSFGSVFFSHLKKMNTPQGRNTKAHN